MTFDFQTFAPALISALVQLLIWAAIQRAIERRDKELDALNREVKDLREKELEEIKAEQRSDAEKRSKIYRRLEGIELGYTSKDDCEKRHAEAAESAQTYMAAVLKLERVATETDRLLKWVGEINQEQISLGKDMAALAEKVNRS